MQKSNGPEPLVPDLYHDTPSPQTANVCPVCQGRIAGEIVRLKLESRMDLEALERDHKQALAAMQVEIKTLRSQIERGEQEVIATRTRMREMLKQHYKDHIRDGVANGTIVTEPKKSEGDK